MGSRKKCHEHEEKPVVCHHEEKRPENRFSGEVLIILILVIFALIED